MVKIRKLWLATHAPKANLLQRSRELGIRVWQKNKERPREDVVDMDIGVKQRVVNGVHLWRDLVVQCPTQDRRN